MTTADLNKYLKNPGLLTDKTLAQSEELVREFPAFDLGWAIWLKNLKNLGATDIDIFLPDVALRVADRKWLRNFLDMPAGNHGKGSHDTEYLSIADYNLTDEPEPLEPAVTQISSGRKMHLIDSFLENGGKIERNLTYAESGENPDLSEKAVAGNDDIVTIKLAEILLKQGNLEKALEAFEKLSLKYPEKSIYFAARIEEIKSSLKI